MPQETEIAGAEEKETAGIKTSQSLVAIIICASVSVVFLNTGLLSMFFLVPLGAAVLIFNSVLLVASITAGLNIVFFVFMRLFSQSFSLPIIAIIEIIYLTTLFTGFAWIMAGSRFTNIRTAYRFILASTASSIIFMYLLLSGQNDSGFFSILKSQAENISSLFVSSAGDDAVRRSYLQQVLTPDSILNAFLAFFMRGGALVTVFFLFFINRQVTITAVWILKKQRNGRVLSSFFVPPNTIWVLSCSLAAVLLTKLLKIEILEIIAWNVLSVCAILFLAQGAGIVSYLLARRSSGFRFAAGILIVLVIISPGLNIIVLAALLLLGISENWVFFRQGQASTPGL